MKKLLLSLFLLSFTLQSQISWGQDCPSVNLMTEVDSPFHKIPVYDQGKINICYAYSAAQMVDYHRILQGAPDKNIHPAWVATLYARLKNKKSLEIGHTKEALEQLQLHANCDYAKVSQALTSFAGTTVMTETRILKAMDENFKREPASLNPVQQLSAMLEAACPQVSRSQIKLPQVGRYNFRQLPNDLAFENFLKSRLLIKKSPIAITYCSNIWKNPDFDGIGLNDLQIRDKLAKNCHYHESLVVGQKQIGNSCNFLVRNTWGSRWTADNKNWNCLCKNKASGAMVDDCRPETHPDASYEVQACWLPGEKVARNIGQITFLQ